MWKFNLLFLPMIIDFILFCLIYILYKLKVSKEFKRNEPFKDYVIYDGIAGIKTLTYLIFAIMIIIKESEPIYLCSISYSILSIILNKKFKIYFNEEFENKIIKLGYQITRAFGEINIIKRNKIVYKIEERNFYSGNYNFNFNKQVEEKEKLKLKQSIYQRLNYLLGALNNENI